MSEVLQTKLDTYIKANDDRYVEITAKLKELNDGLKNKVSYKEFVWVLGIMIMILMAMFGWIAYQIGEINLNSANTDKSVSMIQGKLEPYNVQFKN